MLPLGRSHPRVAAGWVERAGAHRGDAGRETGGGVFAMTRAPFSAPTRCATRRRAVGQAAANPAGAGKWMRSPRRRGGACAPRPCACLRGSRGDLVGLQLNHVGCRQFLRAQHAMRPIQRRDNSTVDVPLDNDINRAIAIPFGSNKHTVASFEVQRGVVPASVGFVCVHNSKVAAILIASTSISRFLKDFLGADYQGFTGLFTEERGGESE
jgi:hypothetical protein